MHVDGCCARARSAAAAWSEKQRGPMAARELHDGFFAIARVASVRLEEVVLVAIINRGLGGIGALPSRAGLAAGQSGRHMYAQYLRSSTARSWGWSVGAIEIVHASVAWILTRLNRDVSELPGEVEGGNGYAE